MIGQTGRLLGLLSDQEKAIPCDTLKKLDELAQIDLTIEKRSFVARHPNEEPYVDILEQELKRFLSLPVLVPDPYYPFAPSLRVDELWHDLILNTQKYRSFCDNIYGVYLDHTPNQEELATEQLNKAREMAEFTNSTLIKYYGALDQAIWGSDIVRPCYPPPPAPASFKGR